MSSRCPNCASTMVEDHCSECEHEDDYEECLCSYCTGEFEDDDFDHDLELLGSDDEE